MNIAIGATITRRIARWTAALGIGLGTAGCVDADEPDVENHQHVELAAQSARLRGDGRDGDDRDGSGSQRGRGGRDGSGDTPPALPFDVPLVIPPVLAPTSSDASSDSYTITTRAGNAQIRAGVPTAIVGYNGSYPGPTIVATRGREVRVTHINAWNESITIHNHGHKVAAASDGHPNDLIRPGASKVYTYPNDQSAGTLWYHDHTMDLTGPHVYKGLAGFYLIKDPAEDALGLPSGSQDIPLLIQDKTLDANNNLVYAFDVWDGQKGNLPVVNGKVGPNLDVATRKYRFRLLDGANTRNWGIQLRRSGTTTPIPFQVVASDAGLLAAPVTVTTLPMAPAERYDIVVDFAQFAVGDKLVLFNSFLSNDDEEPPIGDIMQFTVARSEAETARVPATLASITRMNPAQAAVTRDVTFSFDGRAWRLNGLTYDPARINETHRLGEGVVWSLRNRSGEVHPFHKHLVPFQVLDIDGRAPPAYMMGWKDTVPVERGQTVRIMFKNESFTGTYVFHCHNVEHEDHRMMLQEQVTP